MDDAMLLSEVIGARTSAARRAARRALEEVSDLAALGRCEAEELGALLGDPKKGRRLAAAFELGLRRAALERRPPPRLGSSADVAAWAEARLVELEHEELWVLALDGRGGLRGARRAAQGGLHGLSVRAPDVLRIALRLGASAFVLVHNHPSGDATPSAEDRSFTQAIAEAATVVGLPLLDHVVVARGGFASVRPEPRSA